jgi:hypothetical protein
VAHDNAVTAAAGTSARRDRVRQIRLAVTERHEISDSDRRGQPLMWRFCSYHSVNAVLTCDLNHAGHSMHHLL